jgi:signal transduction histidine kinase
VQRRVDAAYTDASGTVWFGGDRGLWQSTREGFARVQLPSVHFITVRAIARDDSGSVWVSLVRQEPAVYRRVANRWVARGGQTNMPSGIPVSMMTDDSGRVWMGYTQNRIAVWSHGKLRAIGEKEGLHIGDVFATYGRDQHVWVGGQQGLALLTGDRFRSVVSKSGPAFRMITGIVEVANGDVWLHGAPGIARVPAAEVRRSLADTTYQVTAEWLDYRDGLDGAPPEGRVPSMIQSSDGRLWFGTNLEVASIDPSRIARNTRPPNVVIEGLTAGEQKFAIDRTLTLPVNTRSLRIEFTALSLSIPERVRFRYHLEGSGDDWQDVGGRREAIYTNLKPGSYRFQVVAANEDGVWNESGAMLDFTIPPSFTQSRWFLAMWGGLLVAGVWLISRLRMRQMAAGLRAQYQAALTERTRIAQELHDTLLQGFTGITIQLRAIQRVLIRRPEEGVAALDAALTAADTALRDARNTIWDMRAVELEGHDLPEALEGAVRSVLTGAPVALHFTATGDRRPLTPHLETTALRIGREAVVNALKHADARTVEVTLEYDAQFLRLQIRDDGRGMRSGVVEAAAANGHLGIAGMRARAHSAAGTMEIASEPGRGTTVRVSLPIPS